MALRYPWLTLALLVLWLIAAFFLVRIPRQRSGLPAVNTTEILALPAFQKALRLHRLYRLALYGLICSAAVSSSVLAGRPFTVKQVEQPLQQRDIFLCMDVSYSLFDLNSDMTETLIEVAGRLDGDRMGISIFNTTSILYVPMTDNAEFIIEKLRELQTYFDLQRQRFDYANRIWLSAEEHEAFIELLEKLDYYDAGTLVNNNDKGSSLIGEGLATCLYHFPRLNEESRTRVVIMTTDNDERENREPVIRLPEAADLCRSHDVHMFGVYPDREHYYEDALDRYETNRNDLEKGMDQVYIYGDMSTDDILDSIHRTPAMESRIVSELREVDIPAIPLAVLVLSMLGLMILVGIGERRAA